MFIAGATVMYLAVCNLTLQLNDLISNALSAVCLGCSSSINYSSASQPCFVGVLKDMGK